MTDTPFEDPGGAGKKKFQGSSSYAAMGNEYTIIVFLSGSK